MPIDYQGGWTPGQTMSFWGGANRGVPGAGPLNFGYGAGPTGAPAGSLSPASARGYNPAYGGVPYMPDPIASAGRSISGNIGNLGGIYGLTTGTSGASAAGARAQYQANLPGFSGLTASASRNIASDLAGQISPDVVNMLAQQAAERGVASGLGAGAPNTNAALLRALGLTSMDLQRQGQGELTAAIGRTPVGPAFNPASLLVSPGEVQGAQLGANIYGAAPVPAAAAGAAIGASTAGYGAGVGGGPSAGGFGGGGGLAPFQPGGGGWSPGGAMPSSGTDLTYSGASPGAYSRWNDWFNSLNPAGFGVDETAGLGLSPEDDQFYKTYGFLPPGAGDLSGDISGPGLGPTGPPAPADTYSTGPTGYE